MGSMELVRGLQHQQPFYLKEPVSFKSNNEAKVVASNPLVDFTEWNNRNVRFSNVVTLIGTSDCHSEDAWYSTRDCNSFRRQAQIGIRLIQSMEKESADPFFWTKSLGRIFESFEDDHDT